MLDLGGLSLQGWGMYHLAADTRSDRALCGATEGKCFCVDESELALHHDIPICHQCRAVEVAASVQLTVAWLNVTGRPRKRLPRQFTIGDP